MARTDKYNNEFGCKYGKNCVKFRPNNIEESSRLKHIMLKLSDKDFYSWNLIPDLFRLFKGEHSKIAMITSYDKLNSEWKKHFKEYIITRVCCNNGELYKQGYSYYSMINKQPNVVRNYDNITEDSVFFYNYSDYENFEASENSTPVKSYMAKMYADEVKTNIVGSVRNRALAVDGGGSNTSPGNKSASYIVVRAKTSYTASSFKFTATQFTKIKNAINSGTLTNKCSDKHSIDTHRQIITDTQPSATASVLMQSKCDHCSKYHINNLALVQWQKAIKAYEVKNNSIVPIANELNSELIYLANSDGSMKYTNRNTNSTVDQPTPNPSNPIDSTIGDNTGNDNDTTSTPVTDSTSTASALVDHGDPGLYGASGDGTSKDLAMYIRGGVGAGTGNDDTSGGENSVDPHTNADKQQNKNENDGIMLIQSSSNKDAMPTPEDTFDPNDSRSGGTKKGSDAVVDDNTVKEEKGSVSTTSGTEQMEKTTTVEEIEAAAKLAGKSVYGDDISGLDVLTFVPGFPDSDTSHKTSVLGMPMMYNSIADPNGRIYAETTMMDLPIVYIQPGRGQLNNNLDDELADELKEEYKNPGKGDFNFKDANGATDLRTLAFEEAFLEYIDYFNNLASTVYGNMGLGVFNWLDQLNGESSFSFKNLINRGANDGTTTNIWTNKTLVFFADTATSVSDSFSNEFSDGPIVSAANNLALLSRNIRMMLIQNSTQMAFEDVSSGWGDNSDTNTSKLTGLLNDIIAKGATIWNGSQILFPQVWNDSRHDRSYNLSFKFFSPYGNKEAIFQKVYLPVLALMTLTLPRMDTISGYAQPFYVRVESPGWFETSIGVIQSLTIERGGDDRLWNVDGLPLEINCTVTIQDMYSTTSLTKNSKLTAFNIGLISYIGNMAGIRSTKLIDIANYEGWFMSKLSKLHYNVTSRDTLLISDGVYTFINKLLN